MFKVFILLVLSVVHLRGFEGFAICVKSVRILNTPLRDLGVANGCSSAMVGRQAHFNLKGTMLYFCFSSSNSILNYIFCCSVYQDRGWET
jgi:hypothetical protein